LQLNNGINMHVIVWDLETVPDLHGFAAANDLIGKTDDEIREAIGDKFPKHIYHSIVCIGALVAHKERDHWAIDAVGAPHVGERTEKQLISAFVDKIIVLVGYGTLDSIISRTRVVGDARPFKITFRA
jgi:predicted PolB exonuclease-like 3'-5' exonuclease